MGDNYFLLTNLLSEDERKVITSITAHIERGEKRVGIQQIAAENYLSTASIVKMCKRLGFDGYSELYYHLRAAARAQAREDLYDRRGLFQHRRGLYRPAHVDLRLYGLQQRAFLRLHDLSGGASERGRG